MVDVWLIRLIASAMPRIELADIKDAAPYLEMGVKHFSIGWDVRILFNWWKANGEGMRKMVDGAAATGGKKEAASTY